MKIIPEPFTLRFLINTTSLFVEVPVLSQESERKFISDLRQVGSFLQVLLFPLPIKLTAAI